jgi:S-adenosylhomocysteine hydrolase
MTTAAKNHDVADLSLADAGQARIEWADRHMPVLASIRKRFAAEKPLDGVPTPTSTPSATSAPRSRWTTAPT